MCGTRPHHSWTTTTPGPLPAGGVLRYPLPRPPLLANSTSRPAMRPSLSRSIGRAAWGERTQDGDQDHGADEGDDDRADETDRPGDAEQRQHEATDDRADDADDDVGQQAEAGAGHHLACQPAGDRPDDKPRDDPAGLQVHRTASTSLGVHRVACPVRLIARHRHGAFLDLARAVERRRRVVARLRRQRVEPFAHLVRAAEPEHVRRDGRRRREPDEEPLRHGAPLLGVDRPRSVARRKARASGPAEPYLIVIAGRTIGRRCWTTSRGSGRPSYSFSSRLSARSSRPAGSDRGAPSHHTAQARWPSSSARAMRRWRWLAPIWRGASAIRTSRRRKHGAGLPFPNGASRATERTAGSVTSPRPITASSVTSRTSAPGGRCRDTARSNASAKAPTCSHGSDPPAAIECEPPRKPIAGSAASSAMTSFRSHHGAERTDTRPSPSPARVARATGRR